MSSPAGAGTPAKKKRAPRAKKAAPPAAPAAVPHADASGDVGIVVGKFGDQIWDLGNKWAKARLDAAKQHDAFEKLVEGGLDELAVKMEEERRRVASLQEQSREEERTYHARKRRREEVEAEETQLMEKDVSARRARLESELKESLDAMRADFERSAEKQRQELREELAHTRRENEIEIRHKLADDKAAAVKEWLEENDQVSIDVGELEALRAKPDEVREEMTAQHERAVADLKRAHEQGMAFKTQTLKLTHEKEVASMEANAEQAVLREDMLKEHIEDLKKQMNALVVLAKDVSQATGGVTIQSVDPEAAGAAVRRKR